MMFYLKKEWVTIDRIHVTQVDDFWRGDYIREDIMQWLKEYKIPFRLYGDYIMPDISSKNTDDLFFSRPKQKEGHYYLYYIRIHDKKKAMLFKLTFS